MRMLMYYPVITLGPLLILLGQYLQGQLMGFLKAELFASPDSNRQHSAKKLTLCQLSYTHRTPRYRQNPLSRNTHTHAKRAGGRYRTFKHGPRDSNPHLPDLESRALAS